MRAVVLARYPDGVPAPGDFRVVDVAAPEPAAGEVVVAVAYLSMDPAVRLRLAAASAMAPPARLGEVVPGRGVGVVVASREPGFAEGDVVTGELGWRTHAGLPAGTLTRVDRTGPLHHHLNALGPTGLAAWLAVDLARPVAGETALVAPAAGAVGSIAAQLARGRGARVLGTARGDAQRAYLTSIGVEPEPDPLPPLDALIDGVGGAFHDRAVCALAPRARTVLIGFVAGYNQTARPRYGDAHAILMRRATMTGFLLADHADRFAEAAAGLAAALADGSLVPAQHVWRGLEQAPAAFAALFGDAPPGKQLVQVREHDDG